MFSQWIKYDWLIVSVGYTTKDEDYLKFLFEGSPDFCVVPSFAVIPAMNASTGMFMGGVPGLRVDPTKVTKTFSSSAQLSMKFQLLINVEIVKISGKFRFKSQKQVIYRWHFNIYF